MLTNKNIVVLYHGDDWKKAAPEIGSATTQTAFEEWYKRGRRHGLTMFRAHIDWYDVQTGVFKKAWTYNKDGWVKIKKTIKPDLIYDKVAGKYDYELFGLKLEMEKRHKMFNSPLFRVSADSKLNQYLMFRDIMPTTFLATNKKGLRSALLQIRSYKVVLKPIYGSGGFGITITAKKEAPHKKTNFPVLVQEFVENRGGIPGFTQKNKIADLRMVFFNHKFMYALSRIAKSGSFFTNFHQGATPVFVPKKAIPKNAWELARIVTKRFSIFPYAQYSVDLYFQKNKKPLLMEVNTTPGFDLLHLVGSEQIKEREIQELICIFEK